MSVPTFVDEEIGQDGKMVQTKYYSCPVRFVPSNVYDFLAMYDYMKRFPASNTVKYDEASPRFRQAVLYYDLQCTKFTSEALNGN